MSHVYLSCRHHPAPPLPLWTLAQFSDSDESESHLGATPISQYRRPCHICASGVSKIFSHAKLEDFICCNIFEHMYYQQYQYKYKGGEFHQFPPYNTFIFAQQIYNIT